MKVLQQNDLRLSPASGVRLRTFARYKLLFKQLLKLTPDERYAPEPVHCCLPSLHIHRPVPCSCWCCPRDQAVFLLVLPT